MESGRTSLRIGVVLLATSHAQTNLDLPCLRTSTLSPRSHNHLPGYPHFPPPPHTPQSAPPHHIPLPPLIPGRRLHARRVPRSPATPRSPILHSHLVRPRALLSLPRRIYISIQFDEFEVPPETLHDAPRAIPRRYLL